MPREVLCQKGLSGVGQGLAQMHPAAHLRDRVVYRGVGEAHRIPGADTLHGPHDQRPCRLGAVGGGPLDARHDISQHGKKLFGAAMRLHGVLHGVQGISVQGVEKRQGYLARVLPVRDHRHLRRPQQQLTKARIIRLLHCPRPLPHAPDIPRR